MRFVTAEEAGVVKGEKKRTHPGKVVSSFVMGTRRLTRLLREPIA